ncbi:MAG: WecB/TagA/CpsF family glycosyltransferase [Anaerolineae bacterium]|nr:WecB/TagA/CpsF family glycosyltransferase [Anaerolineae bacterium]
MLSFTVDAPPGSLRVLGVRVDAVTYRDVLERAAAIFGGAGARQIVTLNPEMLLQALRDADLASAIDSAELVVPDGVGLLLAGRLLGRPLPGRVTGVDLVPRLCQLAAERGWSVYFLGAAPGVAELCATVLRSRLPALRVAGCYSGSPALEEQDAILARLAEARPDLLLVAYGVPAEEKWIARNLDRLPARLAMGVGGAFDFIAGVVPRAPVWMRRWGLEWLYRLYRQPWRWRRMLALPVFLLRVLAEAARTQLTCRHRGGG